VKVKEEMTAVCVDILHGMRLQIISDIISRCARRTAGQAVGGGAAVT